MWLFIALLAHILFGIVFVIDRFLVSKVAPHPLVYTFLVALLQGLVIFLIPLGVFAPLVVEIPIIGSFLHFLFPEGFSFPTAQEFLTNSLAAAAFLAALFLLFSALRIGEASRVIPIAGSTNPIFAFFLGILLLSERLSAQELIAFGFLVCGGIMISLKRFSVKGFTSRELFFALAAGAAFALFFVLSKLAFETQPFLNAFVWIRILGALFAVGLLAIPLVRSGLAKMPKLASQANAALFFGGQTIAAVAGTSQHLAVFFASPALVNALQGVQYVVLFSILLVLARWFPRFLKEEMEGVMLAQKIVAIALIGFGLYLLAQSQ